MTAAKEKEKKPINY